MPKLSPEDQAIREEYDKSQKRLTNIRALCEKSHLDSFKNIVAITEKFKNINWYDVLEESAKVEVDPELLRVYTGVILYFMSQANDEIRSICRNQGNALRQELSLPQKTPDAWFSLNHLRSVVDNIEGLLKAPVEDLDINHGFDGIPDVIKLFGLGFTNIIASVALREFWEMRDEAMDSLPTLMANGPWNKDNRLLLKGFDINDFHTIIYNADFERIHEWTVAIEEEVLREEQALKVHVAEVDQELARMIPELLKALENKPRTKAPLEDAVKYLDVLLKLKNHCSKNVATLKAHYDDFRARGVVLPFIM